MSADKRFSKSSGSCCAVIGCNNSTKKRFLWENEKCNKHIGKLKMFCKCPRPFRMFTFPKAKSDVSNLCRMTWISNLKRKNFKPSQWSVVCSDHFIEGRPTNKHPYPEIKLGHKEKITKSRSTKSSMNLMMPSVCKLTSDAFEDVAQFVEVGTEDATVMEDLHCSALESDTLLQALCSPPVLWTISTPKQRKFDLLSEHNYFRTKQSVCDKGTQTKSTVISTNVPSLSKECLSQFKFMSDKYQIEEATARSKLNEEQPESGGDTVTSTSTSSSNSFENSGNITSEQDSYTDFELIGKHEVILDFVKEEPPEYPHTHENFILLSNEAARRDPIGIHPAEQVLQHTPDGLDNLNHPKAKGKREPNSKYNSFTCSQCGDEFKYRDDLYYHRMTTHDPENTANRNVINEEPVESSKKEYADPKTTRVKSQQCLLCPKAYYTTGHLTDHLRRAHSDPTFKCEVCGKVFRHPGDFRIHKTRHSSETPVECTICSAKFRNRASLWGHRHTHLTEKKFKCDMCSAAFVRASSLYRHKVGHNPKREFPCTYCSRIFVRACQLKSHLITHSEQKPFVCEVCGKGHKRARSLRDHVRKKHTVVGI